MNAPVDHTTLDSFFREAREEARKVRLVQPSMMERAHQQTVGAVRTSVLRLSLPDQMAIVEAIARRHEDMSASWYLSEAAVGMASEFRAAEAKRNGEWAS